MPNALPQDLESRLARMIARVRMIIFARGLLATLAVACGAVLAVMAIDAAVVLIHPAARWGFSLAGAGLILLTAWSALIRPLTQRLSLTRMARVLETRHPEMQERISSAIELSEHGDAQASAELLGLLSREAATEVSGVRPRSEFTWQTAKPVLVATAVAILLFSLIFAIWPKQGWLLFRRAVAPFVEFDTLEAQSIHVTPGDTTVLTGLPLELKAEAPIRRGIHAELLFTYDNGSKRMERMTQDPAVKTNAAFTLALPAVERPFFYRVRYGHALTRPYRINALPPPDTSSVTVELTYPSYTGIAATQLTANAAMPIEGIAGTRVSIRAAFNRPCESALRLNVLRLAPQMSGFNSDAAWRQTLTTNITGHWAFSLRDANGFTNIAAWATWLVTPDMPPTVTLESPPADKLRIQPNERIECTGTASDDFALSRIELIAAAKDGENVWPVEPNGKTAVLNVTPDFGKLADLKIQSFELFFRVTDNRSAEFGGPQITESRHIRVQLDQWAKTLREQIREEAREQIEKHLRESARDLREAGDKLAQERDNLGKQELPEKTAQKLDQARVEAAKAEEKMDEAAKATKKTPFAELAKDILDLRDQKVEEAFKKLEAVPTAATPEQRRKAGEEAERAFREAEQKVNEFANQKLQQESQKQENISKVQELAQRENDLAQSAKEPMQKWAQREWDKRQQENEQKLWQAKQDIPEQAFKESLDALHEARNKMQQAEREQTQKQDGDIWFEKMAHEEAAKAANLAEKAAQTALDANQKAEALAQPQTQQKDQAERQQGEQQQQAGEQQAEQQQDGQQQQAEQQQNGQQQQADQQQQANQQQQNGQQQQAEQQQNGQQQQADKQQGEQQQNGQQQQADQQQQANQQQQNGQQQQADKQQGEQQQQADQQQRNGQQQGEQAEQQDNQNGQDAEQQNPLLNAGLAPAPVPPEQREAVKAEANAEALDAARQADAAAKQAKQTLDKLKNNEGHPMNAAAENAKASAQLSKDAATDALKSLDKGTQADAKAGEAKAKEALELARQAREAAQNQKQAEGAQREASEQAQKMADAMAQLSKQQQEREAQAWAQAASRIGGGKAQPGPAGAAGADKSGRIPDVELNNDWMRLKGQLKSDSYDEMLKKTPAEYRPLVKQYFEELGKGEK